MSGNVLLSAPVDSAFVQRLVADLTARDIAVSYQVVTDIENYDFLSGASCIIVVLSEEALQLPAFTKMLSRLEDVDAAIIVLRVSTVTEIPGVFKGVLPLNFSDADVYADSLESLVEDLQIRDTAEAEPIIPIEITSALDSADVAERRYGVEKLGQLSNSTDPAVREYAEERLGILIFRDPDPTIKQLARVTAQMFNQAQQPEPEPVSAIDLEDETDPALDVESSGMGPGPDGSASVANAPLPDTATRPLNQGEEASEIHRLTSEIPMKPLWKSQYWWSLIPGGILLAVCTALLAESMTVLLAVLLVWLGLPWFNILIRDEGKFEWVMPGALIGNGVAGLILGLVGGAIGLIIDSSTFLIFLLSVGLATLYGGLIGWISTLYTRF